MWGRVCVAYEVKPWQTSQQRLIKYIGTAAVQEVSCVRYTCSFNPCYTELRFWPYRDIAYLRLSPAHMPAAACSHSLYDVSVLYILLYLMASWCRGSVQAPGRNSPLILALYIYCLLVYILCFPTCPCFLHFFFTYLLLNLALVFCVYFLLRYISFDWWMHAFIVLGLVFSIPSQEIGLGKRLRNNLFCVEWDVKPQLSQSVLIQSCALLCAWLSFCGMVWYGKCRFI